MPCVRKLTPSGWRSRFVVGSHVLPFPPTDKDIPECYGRISTYFGPHCADRHDHGSAWSRRPYGIFDVMSLIRAKWMLSVTMTPLGDIAEPTPPPPTAVS